MAPVKGGGLAVEFSVGRNTLNVQVASMAVWHVLCGACTDPVQELCRTWLNAIGAVQPTGVQPTASPPNSLSSTSQICSQGPHLCGHQRLPNRRTPWSQALQWGLQRLCGLGTVTTKHGVRPILLGNSLSQSNLLRLDDLPEPLDPATVLPVFGAFHFML